MKRFKLTALLAAMFSISIAVTGCGGDDGEELKPGGPGAPGFNGGILPPGAIVNPGSAVTIPFSANQIYNSGILMIGGDLNSPNCHTGSSTVSSFYSGPTFFMRYCNQFGGIMQTVCHSFAGWNYSSSGNQQTAQVGQVTLSGGGVGYGQGVRVYNGNSVFEPGATISMYGSAPDYNARQSLTGTLTLPPSFTTRLANQQVMGLSLDLAPVAVGGDQFTVTGGVLIYTSRDQSGCYRGQFLKL